MITFLYIKNILIEWKKSKEFILCTLVCFNYISEMGGFLKNYFVHLSLKW